MTEGKGPGEIVVPLGDGFSLKVWGTQRMWHICFIEDAGPWWDGDIIKLPQDKNVAWNLLCRAAAALEKIDLRELPE